MVTRVGLQELVAELEAAQARARILNQISGSLNRTRDQDELLQILAWLTFAATAANYPRRSGRWTMPTAC